jgi:transglutaminase-like putative cysteine protease
MKFKIIHNTRYDYSAPVTLGHHVLRFQPGNDARQHVHSVAIDVKPEPTLTTQNIDLEGNLVSEVWFEGPTEFLQVDVRMEVDTVAVNPYNYIVLPGFETLPMYYPNELGLNTMPYCTRQSSDQDIIEFANRLAGDAGNQVVPFLNLLTETMYTMFHRHIREEGGPQSPSVTLKNRSGACRDLTVLFMEVCRSLGLAARFVSGYQKGDVLKDRRYMHAWPEVYVPGGGWRGFDPAHGLAVVDEHVAVVMAALPRNTTPIEGVFYSTDAIGRMSPQITIEVSE